MESDPAGETASVVTSFLRTLGVIGTALLCCLVFGFMGSLTSPGLGAVIGGFAGVVFGAIVGFFACGKYKEVLESADDMIDAQHFVPEAFHEGLFGHQRFTLYVTVHKLVNGGSQSFFSLSAPDFFIRVVCGRNPPKTTCVKGDGVWNETFRFMVEAQDTSVAFEVIDQNTLIDTKVGSVAVPIKSVFDLLDQPPKPYKIRSKARVIGELVVSFKAGEDISTSYQIPQHLLVQDTSAGQTSGAKWYGTFTQSGTGYFNTSTGVNTTQATPGAPGATGATQPGSRGSLNRAPRGALQPQPSASRGARSPFGSAA